MSLNTIRVPSITWHLQSQTPLYWSNAWTAGNRTGYRHTNQIQSLATSHVLRKGRTGPHWWVPKAAQSLLERPCGLQTAPHILDIRRGTVPKRHVSTSDLPTEQLLPLPRAATALWLHRLHFLNHLHRQHASELLFLTICVLGGLLKLGESIFQSWNIYGFFTITVYFNS